MKHSEDAAFNMSVQRQPTILTVEDESALSEVLRYNLEAEGFRVVQAADGEEGMLMALEEEPDLILLDWMLPKLSGIEVCRRLRAQAQTRLIPIVMLSARSEDVDKVRGLETGADDYVVKPYSIVELMARLRTQLRRTRPASVNERLVWEDLVLDTEEHRVYRAGQPITVGPTEFRLLTTFMEKPKRVWTREQLLDRVWGRDVYVETRTIDVHVGRLRKALMKHGDADPIRTVRGTGYSLG